MFAEPIDIYGNNIDDDEEDDDFVVSQGQFKISLLITVLLLWTTK